MHCAVLFSHLILPKPSVQIDSSAQNPQIPEIPYVLPLPILLIIKLIIFIIIIIKTLY
jgi:hypothetical protein